MISVVGLGPGSADYLTPLARCLIDKCDWLVGSTRQLAAVSTHNAQTHLLDKSLVDLVEWLTLHQDDQVVVLASGDPMLYGLGKYLNQQMPSQLLRVVPGISSIQYLFARIGLDMNEVYLTSSHGKTPNFDFMLQHAKVALVTDNILGPYQIAQEIIKRGLQRTLVIGENLSYPNERIMVCSVADVEEQAYQMNVVVIVDER